MAKGSWREFGDSPATSRPDQSLLSIPKSARHVRVQRTRGGKSGKTVTLITGLELNASDLKLLLKKLKVACGTGGTVKADLLELQGDQLQGVIDLLTREGFAPKKSGG